MRTAVLLATLSLFAVPALADVLPCETLKARVDAKLQAKGVQTYTLEIVPIENPAAATAASGVPATEKAGKGKQVGTCDGGTKRLIYTRGN